MNLFSPLNVADKDLDRVQERIGDAFDKVARNFIDVSHTVQVALNNASDTQVFHGLGRVPRGWIVVWATAAASPYEGAASTNYASFVNLRASAAATLTLVFF